MKLVERFSASLLFILLAIVALILCIYRPYHNWDMIGYIAAAKSFEERDIKSLHTFTYDQLRNSVPIEKYEMLIGGSYNHAISTDSTAFEEQLPFYRIRPVYTGLIYLLYKIGINIGFATNIVSGVAIIAAIAILYIMSVSFLAKPFIYAVPPLAIFFSVVDLARLSSPDGLAFLAVVLSSYLFLKKRISLLLILLPIIIGIRTDLILFTIPLLLFVLALHRISKWKIALSLFTSVVIYMGIGIYWENPGWSTIFYFTLVHVLTHPISMPPTLTPQHYLIALFKGTKSLVDNKLFILYVIVTVYSLYMIKEQVNKTSLVIAFKDSSILTIG